MGFFKLPRFFTRLYVEGKRAAISKLTYTWTPSSRSYIVFALEAQAKMQLQCYQIYHLCQNDQSIDLF